MKRYATRYIPLLAGVLAVTTACEHKELCFDHDEHAPKSAVHIQAEYEQEWELMCEGGTDWENEWKEEFGMEYDELRPDVPGGLRIQLYHEDGINNMLNVAPEGEVVQMRPGNHSVLLYNNDTESIVFDDMDSYASAKATTRTRTRASYFGSPYTEGSDENTVTEPDILYGSYIESYTAERKLETDELPVTMHPLVFRYLVRYEFKHGLEYVAWHAGRWPAWRERGGGEAGGRPRYRSRLCGRIPAPAGGYGMDAHGEQRLGNRYPGAVYPPDREYRVHTGVYQYRTQGRQQLGRHRCRHPEQDTAPEIQRALRAADWNDDHKYNRGSSFTIYGGSRRIQLYERGMYNVNVELNFTYFV